jgi:hypothetical protein
MSWKHKYPEYRQNVDMIFDQIFDFGWNISLHTVCKTSQRILERTGLLSHSTQLNVGTETLNSQECDSRVECCAYSLVEVEWRFRGACSLHHQYSSPWWWGRWASLKLQVSLHQTARCNSLEDNRFHTRRHENLRSHLVRLVLHTLNVLHFSVFAQRPAVPAQPFRGFRHSHLQNAGRDR